MRLSVTYESGTFDIAYRMMFLSLIKKALSTEDQEYFEKLYKYEDKSNKAIKNFCYSVFFENLKQDKSKNEITCDSVRFNISSPDSVFMLKLYNGLVKTEEYTYKNYKLKKVKVEIVKEKKIENDYAMFKTLSPLYLQNIDKKPITVEDEGFEERLNHVANLILESHRGYGLKKKLEFINLNMKKVVVKEKLTKFTEKTNKEYMFINASKGEFV